MSALPSWDELKAAAEEGARQAADEWLAGALRKLAADPAAMADVYARINAARSAGRDLVTDVVAALADHVEGKTREDR